MLKTLESRFSVTRRSSIMVSILLDAIDNQVYCVGLEVSQPIPLKYGVPQGSPWQVQSISFVTPKTLRWSSPIFRYDITCDADDMQLLAKTLPQHLDSCRQELEDCTAAIQDWCRARKLQLNSDKIELIWFGSKQSDAENSARKVIHPGMWRPSQSGSAVSGIVGVLLDSQLDMKSPINSIVSVGFYHLRRLATAAADPESRPSSKASISLDLVEDLITVMQYSFRIAMTSMSYSHYID